MAQVLSDIDGGRAPVSAARLLSHRLRDLETQRVAVEGALANICSAAEGRLEELGAEEAELAARAWWPVS